MAHQRASIVAVDLHDLKTTLPTPRPVEIVPAAPEPQESRSLAIPEQDYLIPFSCRLPMSLHQKLDELKRERGLDKTEVVKAALAAHLKKLGKG
jgi:hypothetical protein